MCLMSVRRLLFIALGMILVTTSASPQQTDKTGVVGVVVDAGTGEPLARVHVRLFTLSEPHLDYGALTTGKGRFSIVPMTPGTYGIKLERAGFVEKFILDTDSDETFAQITEGHQLELKLSMERQTVFSGRVLDEFGEPMMYVAVHLKSAGRPNTDEVSQLTSETNDRGEFQINAPPGKYYLVARYWRLPGHGPVYQGEIRSDGTKYAPYVETFFPSARRQVAATMVEGKSGSEVNGLEIRMARAGILSVTGVVSGIPKGAEWTEVRLVPYKGGNSNLR